MLKPNSRARSYRVAVLTASDKGAAGQRIDDSGPLICDMVLNAGYLVQEAMLLPDEQDAISNRLRQWSESGVVDMILTTGGTGLAPRDCMPEATLAVADRLVPGIPEAMRAYSNTITPRGMLSRGVAAVCRQTLIINLPGSPKAVRETLEYVLPTLEHALDMLTGAGSECATNETLV
ncbi:MAG: MogA/MoaB family molybdenum cofactor biosynthesis protein [Ruminococcaceae bacterium]|nr:MogA/MoaB family molybdenum cofactor biosynthesis protein [Oscillospiraceae bacterium]